MVLSRCIAATYSQLQLLCLLLLFGWRRSPLLFAAGFINQQACHQPCWYGIPGAKTHLNTHNINPLIAGGAQLLRLGDIHTSKASGLLDEEWQDTEIRPRLSKLADRIVRRVVTSRTKSHLNLNVTCFSPSNRKMLSGFIPNVNITFDELYFDKLQITGGAKLQVMGADFKVLAFPVKWLLGRLGAPARPLLRALKRPLEVYVEGALTAADLRASPAVRRTAQTLLRLLVERALRDRPLLLSSEVVAVAVRDVQVSQGSLAFDGVLNTAVTYSSIPFRIRTGLVVKNRWNKNAEADQGHVIALKDPELVINYRTPYALTVPVLTYGGDIDIDIGESAKIEDLEITEEGVALRARVLFSNVAPFRVGPQPRRALYAYDLGAFLSETWGFHDL
mmetsp:Transcript_24334/g.33637  ORF Transcript_24334/g.33637 Transcript_24334/m.33637 type:complete len:391 (+) Transcript_24334:155-1327(+)